MAYNSSAENMRIMQQLHHINMLAQQQQYLGAIGLFGQQLAPSSPPAPLARSDIQVRDLIGWRVWRVTSAGYLQSLSASAIWLPDEPMTGIVGDYDGRGVHVFTTRANAIAVVANHGGRFAIGSVKLWGEVVEHEQGYRAENARIMSIDDVIWDTEPPWSDTVAKALTYLRSRYGVHS